LTLTWNRTCTTIPRNTRRPTQESRWCGK
jgi:hypothetical protein